MTKIQKFPVMKLEQFDDIADFGINLLVRWNYDDTFALDGDDD